MSESANWVSVLDGPKNDWMAPKKCKNDYSIDFCHTRLKRHHADVGTSGLNVSNAIRLAFPIRRHAAVVTAAIQRTPEVMSHTPVCSTSLPDNTSSNINGPAAESAVPPAATTADFPPVLPLRSAGSVAALACRLPAPDPALPFG